MSQVDVFCKIPNGIRFPLKNRVVTLPGVPLSRLMDSSGKRLPESGYGKTTVTADEWAEMQHLYGSMPAFNKETPLIFARESGKNGECQAGEQAGLRTGLEQIQVEGPDRDKTLKTHTPKKG